MVSVAEIWRHPIKAHGAEPLDRVDLTAGECLPFDRHWAAPHAAAQLEGTAWAHCRNFSRGAGAPDLMAVTARFDPASNLMTLNHPSAGTVEFDPDNAPQEFLRWANPLIPEGRPATTGLIRADVPMTDNANPLVSIMNMASMADLGRHLNHPMDSRRFRGNIWLDGVPAWDEENWVGQRIIINDVEFEVVEPINRCRATEANPDTGKRDADTLGGLRHLRDHTHFGMLARVKNNGSIAVGDTAQVPA